MGEQMRAALAALAHRWVEEGWRQGDGSIVDHLHAPDFLDHDSAGRPKDSAGFREGIMRLFGAFPDFHATVRDLVIDLESVGPHPCAGATADAGKTGAPAAVHATCGTVAVRWTAVGTHKAPYLGLAPTGRRIVFKGIEIIRVREGLITDRWGEWDGLDLLAQLERTP